ncbi:hypothetical protein ABIA31_000808 [Catenulispora sp. MAP5-51]|uniref:DUF7919 family protein n=1 Tax=Catenulispora sp. MAP5-51 TaxID=3156298 RepID=UPI0035114C54
MTYFPDLTPYVYWPQHVTGPQPHPDGVEVLNVGWLEAGHDFPTREGEPDPEFLRNLITLAADHFSQATRGMHACDLPHADRDEDKDEDKDEDFQVDAVYGDRELFLGHAEIRVVTPDGRWLVAPTLVVHYVRDHGYQPPEEFVDAVKAMRIAPSGR